MRTTRLSLVMIASLNSGCLQSGPPVKANDRSTKQEIAAASKADAGTSISTGTDGAADLGVQPDFSLTYYADTKALFDKYCTSCHGATASGGAPTDFTLGAYDTTGGKLGIYAKRDRIAVRIADASMPTDVTLSGADKIKILSWISAGAPVGDDPNANDATATIINPAKAAENPTANVFTIRVAFTKAPEDSNYTLYYSSMGATTGGTLIAEDIPTTDLTTPWNTASISVGGNYYVYLVLFDGDGTKLLTVGSTGSIHVDNSTATNHAPTVSLTGKLNGSNTTVGAILTSQNLPLTYTAADADNDALTVKIEYRETNAINYTTMVTNHPAASPYNFDPASLVQGTGYSFRITATDGKLSTQAVSAAPVGVAETDYTAAEFKSTIIDFYCASCHSATGIGHAAPNGFDTDVTSNTHDRMDDVLARTFSSGANIMPRAPNSPLPDDQKIIVQLWYWQGGR